MGVQVGGDWRVYCHTYDDHTPILTVDAGLVSIAYSIKSRCPDDDALGFARALARDAQAFAAEVERLHAELAATGDHDDSDTKAAPDAAA
jgi:hypothetical protein